MNECMHQLVADWVDEMIVFLFYFDSQKKAGSLNIFFILKYRRQFKWRQQIMGPKVVIASAKNFSFLLSLTGALKLGLTETCQLWLSWIFAAFSFLFLLIYWGPRQPPISRISNLIKGLAPHLLACFLAAMNKKRIKYQKVWHSLGHSLVSSCFQFSQKFCDLVAKKWEAMDCVYANIELRKTTLFMKSIEIKDFLCVAVILISLPFSMYWN